MAAKFEDVINGMLNVSFGAAAVAAEKGKGFLDELNAKGEEARKEAGAPDIARSISDAFEQAGGAVSGAAERLGAQGASFADRALDELVLLRARALEPAERQELIAHLTELIENADVEPVAVEIEVEAEAEADAAPDAKPAADPASAEE